MKGNRSLFITSVLSMQYIIVKLRTTHFGASFVWTFILSFALKALISALSDLLSLHINLNIRLRIVD